MPNQILNKIIPALVEFKSLKRYKKSYKTHWRYIPNSGHTIENCPKCNRKGYLYLVMNFDSSITQRVSHHKVTLNNTIILPSTTCVITK